MTMVVVFTARRSTERGFAAVSRLSVTLVHILVIMVLMIACKSALGLRYRVAKTHQSAPRESFAKFQVE